MRIGKWGAMCAGIAAIMATPVFADPNHDEGVVIAIMGTSDRVDLLPGQAIIFTPEAGRMTMIRFVEGPMEPEDGELKLEFSTLAGSTSLIVSSKSEQAYHYRAEILKQLGAKKGKATPVCTIIAGGSAFESWPQPIAAIRVMDFKPEAEGEMSCR